MPDKPWELNNKLCPLCGAQDVEKTRDRTLPPLGLWIDCATCGSYGISHHAARAINSTDKPHFGHKYILSGVTREASEHDRRLSITTDNIDQLLQSTSIPGDHLQAMDRILLYIDGKRKTAAEFVQFSDHDYPIAFAKDTGEFRYYLSNLVHMGNLEHPIAGPGNLKQFRLTAAGWQRVMELSKTERDSDQAFVAMWFAPELGSIYEEGFKPALEAVGYQPVRIDLVQHNQKIDDRIVAEIRRSGLLVADFTGNRGGVYFEAGFAMGLGIPVIWTCKADEIDQVHFDTRQYNHIVWTDADDLKIRLIDRIEATIPGRVRRPEAMAR